RLGAGFVLVTALADARRVAARRAQLRGRGAQLVTGRARHRMLVVLEHRAELRALGRRPIGDEVAPRLGRTVTGPADARTTRAEILLVALGAYGVSAEQGLSVRAERVTRVARAARDHVCVNP